MSAAAACGHLDAVRLLIDGGADVDVNEAEPLRLAARFGRTAVVRLLLRHGADPEETVDDTGDTALYEAAKRGFADVVRAILESGADPDHGAPLVQAANNGYADVVRLLCQHGADPESLDYVHHYDHFEHEISALMAAAENGDVCMAGLLLELHAKPDSVALYVAACGGHAGVVKLLLKNGADPNIDGDSGSLLSAAASRGHAGVVGVLLENVTAPPDDPEVKIVLWKADRFEAAKIDALLRAAERGRADVVKLLLAALPETGAGMHLDTKICDALRIAAEVAATMKHFGVLMQLLERLDDLHTINCL